MGCIESLELGWFASILPFLHRSLVIPPTPIYLSPLPCLFSSSLSRFLRFSVSLYHHNPLSTLHLGAKRRKRVAGATADTAKCYPCDSSCFACDGWDSSLFYLCAFLVLGLSPSFPRLCLSSCSLILRFEMRGSQTVSQPTRFRSFSWSNDSTARV